MINPEVGNGLLQDKINASPEGLTFCHICLQLISH